MNLTDNIKLFENSVYFVKENILALGDLHIGLEEAMNKQGFLIPRFQSKDLIKNLKSVISHFNPNKIIILGDLKHEFGLISRQEWEDTIKVLELLEKSCKELILIKGNHDKILGPIANRKSILLKEFHSENNIFFCHGDKLFNEENPEYKKSKFIIIGHEHPAITLRDEYKSEKYKCYLYGNYQDKHLLILPSFSTVAQGTDILKENLLSPFLKNNKDVNLNEFNVLISAEEIMDFGKIKTLKINQI